VAGLALGALSLFSSSLGFVRDGPVDGKDYVLRGNTADEEIELEVPLDMVDQPLDFLSAARACGCNFLRGVSLANLDQLPDWN